MKNYKKALLAISVVAALPLMAATVDDTIYVTTFADEDGENKNACSLREAIQTASDNKSYGGCAVGKKSPDVTDRIELKAGEYTIGKPLTPSSMVNILGETPADWSEKDIITGDYPKRLPKQTIIKGNNSFSLFDTTSGKSNLTLQSVRLESGKSARGGAIKAGATVSLVQVEIANSSANEGGAIYLSGVGSTLDVTNSVFEGNTATRGAVLAMSCLDNLTFTGRTISIKGSSIVNNGQASTLSVMEACGVPDLSLSLNTIAQNTASTSNGSIIKFTGDSVPGQNADAILSASSKLTMVSNTIVNNTSFSTLLYDAFGTKSLNYNILAFNNGQSCRYLLGELPADDRLGFSTGNNGIMKAVASSSYCQLPYAVIKDETSKDISSYTQSTLMTSLQPASEYTAYLPMYFLTDYEDHPLVNVDGKESGCEAIDQRGLNRLAQNKLILDAATGNSCDIGSTELTRLVANDMTSSNISQVKTLEGFEAEFEFFEELIADEETDEKFIEYYEHRRDYFKKRIEDYKDSLRYRQAYFDIFANSVPAEISVNGKREIQHFDENLYNVTATALGKVNVDVFAKDDTSALPAAGSDAGLKCEWNNDLQALLMYRTDFQADEDDVAVGDYNYCKYTITLKSDPSIQSIGLAQATLVNIAPIAEDDEYSMKWGTDQRVKVDLLANDNDDGDGTSEQVGFPTGKKAFWVSEDGIPAPIKLGDIDSSLIIEAEHRVLCPDDSRKWCYGGEIHIRPKSIFNKFNYDIEYQVFDADATLSNSAKIYLISTATTSDDTRGGGGSLGIFSALGLVGLALWRRQVKRR